MTLSRVVVLNPPSPNEYYLNRDLMGGMGVENSLPSGIGTRLLAKIKSNILRMPVVQLAYGATLLKQAGHPILVVDSTGEDLPLDKTIERVVAFNPDYVLMAVSSGGLIFERDIVANILKKKIPNLKIIVVGDMIAEMPDQLLPHFDVGIVGEVEQNILDLVNGKDPSLTVSTVYQKDGKVVKKDDGTRLSMPQLEALPFPDWSLFPYKNYRYHPAITVTPVTAIQASRGCPYNCGYCPYTRNQGRAWRARSAKNIFDEMKYNIDKFGIHGFFFRDPLFTANIKRVDELCDMIIADKMSTQFVFETRPELLTRPLTDKLAKAGCRMINFGVEDIHANVLKAIHRVPIDINIVKDIIPYCEKMGIRTSCFFILGLPESTLESIQETVNFAIDLMPSHAEFKIATPFPGTDLHDMARKNNWIKEESFSKLGGYNATMQINDSLPPELLEKLAKQAFNRFYFRSRYVFREVRRGAAFTNAYYFAKALIT